MVPPLRLASRVPMQSGLLLPALLVARSVLACGNARGSGEDLYLYRHRHLGQHLWWQGCRLSDSLGPPMQSNVATTRVLKDPLLFFSGCSWPCLAAGACHLPEPSKFLCRSCSAS